MNEVIRSAKERIKMKKPAIDIDFNKPTKERNYALDLMKGIAIFLVILYHVGAFANVQILGESINLKDCIKYFFRGILPMCVPIFFFVNGFLLFNKELNIKKHILKIVKLVIFTIFWAIVTYIIISLIRNTKITFEDMIKSISVLKKGYNNHLWFLGTLVILYIFFPLLKQSWDTNKKIFYFFFIVIFIMTIGSNFVRQIYNIICIILNKDMNKYIDILRIFNPVVGIYGFSIIYFMLGGIIAEYKEKFCNRKAKILAPIVFIFSTLLLIIYWIGISRKTGKITDYVFDSYGTIFIAINIICTYIMCSCYRENKFTNYLVKTIGSNTMGIYLFHHIIINVLYLLRLNIGRNTTTKVMYSIIILIISTVLSMLISKIKILRKTISI